MRFLCRIMGLPLDFIAHLRLSRIVQAREGLDGPPGKTRKIARTCKVVRKRAGRSRPALARTTWQASPACESESQVS